MAIKCPKCNADNPDIQRYCVECGAQLKPAHTETKTFRTPAEDSTIGEIISEKYKLLEELGSGGMGVVYKAEQIEPIKRMVAIKIIKLGMDTKQVVARFETERQSLAVMDHPNIAKVYDAGSTEIGRPFFAMELVRGIPITEYCDKHNLTTHERLELFIPLCQAVQHAHQKGVIHRDLKPSNVLVAVKEDKPVPKIIDFGIAKATEHRMTERTLFTEQGQLIGTPEYMSPEQAEMSGLDVDTRTDIYSLGVMLYELLVGVLPFDSKTLREAGFGEIQRIIREKEPPKASTRLGGLGDTQTSIAMHRKTDPNTLLKELKGDLDWITMKAMAKDRTHRYANASELAADIDRYLCDETILARPPSTIYKIKKYIRRHKFGVVAAAIVILAIMIGVVGISIGLIRAKKAERAATQEAAKAQAINEFLQETLGSANPFEGVGRDVTVLEALGEAMKRIDELFEDQPEIEAAVRDTIGQTYFALARYDEAETLLTAALEIRERHYGNDHFEVSVSLRHLGELYRITGNHDKAERSLRRAIAIRQQSLPEGHVDIARAQNDLAVLLWNQGNYDEAESQFKSALAIFRETYGEESREAALTLNNLAVVLEGQGEVDEAETMYRKSLSIWRKLLGNEHQHIATYLSNLSLLLSSKGDYENAESMLREALEIDRKSLGDDHPNVGISLSNLASVLCDKGEIDEAIQMYEKAKEIFEKKLEPNHYRFGALKSSYGACLTKKGLYDEAEEQLFSGYNILQISLGKEHNQTQTALERLVELYEAWRKPEKVAQYRALLKDDMNKK